MHYDEVGRSRRQPRTATSAILRVDKFTTTIPVRFQHLTCVTLYVRGPEAPGGVLGDILRHCQSLKKVRIERRDNDWDAPDTKFVVSHEQEMADAVRGHASLQDFSMIGVTSSLNLLCEALVSLPQLNCVTITADPYYASRTTKTMVPLLSPESLSLLLQHHLTKVLTLTGLFPETPEYTRIFHDAFVRDARTLTIFIHFSGHSQPSAFAYYIRQVMELNQMGRRRLQENSDPRNQAKDAMQLLQLVARRHKNSSHSRGCYSLDTAYLLIRENPWLCCSSPTQIKITRKQKLRRIVEKIWCRSHV